MTNDWFYIDCLNNKKGPVPKESLEVMLEDSVLRPKTLVWSKTLYDWMPAIEVEQLNWKRPVDYAFCSYHCNRVVIKEYTRPPKCSQVEQDEEIGISLQNLALAQMLTAALWLLIGIFQLVVTPNLIPALINIVWAILGFNNAKWINKGNTSAISLIGPGLLLVVNLLLGSGGFSLVALIDFLIRFGIRRNGDSRIDYAVETRRPLSYEHLYTN